MVNEVIESNMFDLIPDVKRAFWDAAAKMRLLSAEKYHGRALPSSAVVSTAEALEAAAKLANELGKHTTELHDSWIQPADMAALARDTIAILEVAAWGKIDTRANELARTNWLTTIETWGREVGEEAA